MHSRTANQARKPISVRQPSSFSYFFPFLCVIFQPDRYPDTAAQLHKRFARTAREAAQIRPTCPGPGGVCAEREQHCHRHQHPACHSSEQREKQLGVQREQSSSPCPSRDWEGSPPAWSHKDKDTALEQIRQWQSRLHRRSLHCNRQKEELSREKPGHVQLKNGTWTGYL